jgi:hypothetical protein
MGIVSSTRRYRELIKVALDELSKLDSEFEEIERTAVFTLLEECNSEISWLNLVTLMVEELSVNDPNSSVFLAQVTEVSPIPTSELIIDMNKQFLDLCNKKDVKITRNCLLIWGFLADKLAGATATHLFTLEVQKFLLSILSTSCSSILRLWYLY